MWVGFSQHWDLLCIASDVNVLETTTWKKFAREKVFVGLFNVQKNCHMLYKNS